MLVDCQVRQAQRSTYKYHLKFFKGGFVLRLGLDDFREINERYGIEYGDKVLKDTAECISGCLKGEQQLYRVVSDEFIIVDYLDNRN